MSTDQAIDIAIYEAQRTHEIELNKATAAFEHAVLAPLFLLNGGGAIAFLTLLGAAARDDSRVYVQILLATVAVLMWAIGLLAAAGATAHAYRSQAEFTRAVAARRYLIEHELVRNAAVLKAEDLTPETKLRTRPESAEVRWWKPLTWWPNEPSDDRAEVPPVKVPRALQDRAKCLQKNYLNLVLLSVMWFVLGVVMAAISIF